METSLLLCYGAGRRIYHGLRRIDETATQLTRISGLLTLAFADVEGRQGFFFGRPMYGSRTVPGTLRDLLPGQRVRIRSSAELSLQMLELSAAQLPIDIDVRARWSVSRHPAGRHLPLLSSNSIGITVAPFSAAP